MRPAYLLLLFTVLFVGNLQPASARRGAAEAAHVLRLSQQKFGWMQRRDTAALAAVLHASLRYIHSNGWIETRADVTRHLADSTLIYHGVSIVTDSAVVVGRTAVVTGRGTFDVSLRGARGQYALLYTEVWARQGRRWWLVQRHACKAP